VVRPNGTKLWLYRYRFGGKRKNMSFGTFPGVGLKAAREKRHNAEKLPDQPAVIVQRCKQDESGPTIEIARELTGHRLPLAKCGARINARHTHPADRVDQVVALVSLYVAT
jgi:hypothetical protein